MAYNEQLADRIDLYFRAQNVIFYEKKMFGGLCFMVNDKMCVGIIKNELMVRIGEENYPEAISKKGSREMNFTGRPMKGYVYLDDDVLDLDVDLEYWLQLALDFNPIAKATKKKLKK
ncbi:TfoX/Sxy family protein [Lutibacter sp.]|uniref:TfoX/Sxy family protein n=1 Tax=Lutibacter sp. TaxID=1925666 RepID=UPI0027346B26|nr:TfoX/Sxy family protein [Lutibacter sp.]MDP3311818.1 TfoX/Sxy family protein [Lutibacter sp.]